MAEKSPQQAVDDYLELWLTARAVQIFEETRKRISLKQLTELLEAGDKTGARKLMMDEVRSGLEDLGASLVDVGYAAAKAEVEDMKNWKSETIRKAELRVNFNRADPIFVRAMNRQKVNMVRQITSEQEGTIKAALNEGMSSVKEVRFGDKLVSGNFANNPRWMARQFRDSVGLTEPQLKAVVNVRRALEAGSNKYFTYNLRDKRHDSLVKRMIEGGKGLKPGKVDEIVERYRTRYVAFRAESIARTESISAVNTGRHAMWDQAVRQKAVKKDDILRFWVSTPDLRTRDSHLAAPGLNSKGRGLNEPFIMPSGEKLLFPGHPAASPGERIRCRCTVRTKIKGASRRESSDLNNRRVAIQTVHQSIPRENAKMKTADFGKVAARAVDMTAHIPAVLPSAGRGIEYSRIIPPVQVGPVKLPASVYSAKEAAIGTSAVDLSELAAAATIPERPITAALVPDVSRTRLRVGNLEVGDFQGARADAVERFQLTVGGIGVRRWRSLTHEQRVREIESSLAGERLDFVRLAHLRSKQVLTSFVDDEATIVLSAFYPLRDKVNDLIVAGDTKSLGEGVRKVMDEFDKLMTKLPPAKDNVVLFTTEHHLLGELSSTKGHFMSPGFIEAFPAPDLAPFDDSSLVRISSTKNKLKAALTPEGDGLVLERGTIFRRVRAQEEADGVILVDLQLTGESL